MIKAICFDLDGVYFTNQGKKAFHDALVSLCKDEDKVVHVLYKSPEMLEFVKSKISEQEFWDFVRKYLSLSLTNEEFRNLWVKGYEIDQEIKELVHKVKEKGYITCTCSNNNVARVTELQKMFNFLEDFDVTVFSYETGFVKPQKEMFEILIERTGVKPEEIIYSDDNEDRIKGASDLGINTFIFQNKAQFITELLKLGVNI